MSYTSIHWNDVNEGDEVTTQTREITRTTIVAAAISTRDFEPVHHDHDAAKRAGVKDIFMNIISTGGFVGKYITDWSGPEGRLKKLDIKLGATVFPGDTLTSTGKVAKKYQEGDQNLVDIEYALSVAMGPHAWGTATIALPA
jgi:acyl dehydratase